MEEGMCLNLNACGHSRVRRDDAARLSFRLFVTWYIVIPQHFGVVCDTAD